MSAGEERETEGIALETMEGEPPKGTSARWWKPIAGALFPLAAVLVVIFLPGGINRFATFVQSHLPLTLPILMVLVSIGVRINELSTASGWLKLCNPLAAGFVTFSTWALVSGESTTRYIWINEEKVLDKRFGVPLVVAAFGLLAVCSLVTLLAEQQGSGRASAWKAVQAALIGVSLFAVLAPYSLFENKSEVEKRLGKSFDLKAFTVALGFRDPSFNQYLGRTASPVQQCVFQRNIAAKNAAEAKLAAFNSFAESEASNQFVQPQDRDKNLSPRKVEIEEGWIVAEQVD